MSNELEHNDLLKYPNYLLSTYQLEIFRQLGQYMEKNDLKKKDIAKKLNVSRPYVSQVLNGQFNFTLKKLIELGIAIEKIPYLEFITPEEYWRREKEGTIREIVYTVSVNNNMQNLNQDYNSLSKYFDLTSGGKLPEKITVSEKATELTSNEY